MKHTIGLGLLIFGVPTLQGALAFFIPPLWLPNLALLVVFGLSMCWRNSAVGLVLAALAGFVVDLFSGGLVGQQALLFVGVFAAARLLSSHVSLVGALPRMFFAALLTALHALALAGLVALFAPGVGPGWMRVGDVALHALVNAAFAPLVTGGVAAILGWLGHHDGGRRVLRFAPRSWA